MKKLTIVQLMTVPFIFAIIASNLVSAQQNVTQIIGDKFPSSVILIYESPNTAVLQGDLIIRSGFVSNPNAALGYDDLVSNIDLWKAMDLLRNQQGYKVQQILVTGQGSVANPHTVYIVMTK